jgi:Zn-dependent M28 family amino/carboxypeptidase
VLLEVAAALKADDDLERSVLFVGFDGEEATLGGGLLGSRHFVSKPTVAKRSIVAMLNLDMVSRGETADLRVCGTKYSPLLKAIVEAHAPRAELKLYYDHERQWRRASDHGPFGDAGIPFLYFGVLDHEDYHQPSDTADKANKDKAARIARLTYLTLRDLANREERPTYHE